MPGEKANHRTKRGLRETTEPGAHRWIFHRYDAFVDIES